VRNDAYASGIASSVKCGIAGVPDDCDGTFVLLGDMPKVSGVLLNQLIDAFEATPSARAVVPVHEGERGNPALIARALFRRGRGCGGSAHRQRRCQFRCRYTRPSALIIAPWRVSAFQSPAAKPL